MTRKACPSSSPKSWTVPMLGWVRPPLCRASARKRSSEALVLGAAGGSRTLTATSRSSGLVVGPPHLAHPAEGDALDEPVAVGEHVALGRSVTCPAPLP